VDQAGRRDQLVSRITTYIQSGTGARDFYGYWPDVHSPQHPGYFRIIQVDFNSLELRQFSDFPLHNGRNAPAICVQQTRFVRRKFATYSVQQFMGIKIQHPISRQ